MNDELQNKPDDELKSIVQTSRANQHVPTSIYHRAKEELESRAKVATERQKELKLTADAVLLSISKSKLGTDVTGKFITIEILEHQFGEKRMQKVNEALQWLLDQDFIEEVEDNQGVYRLTPFGDSKVSALHVSNNTTYSNISNSNIAHQSDNADQTININELTEDVQKSLEELRIAVSKHDASGMKKAFAYIADKAVDVAIAITLGHLKLG
jgi:hypothetical protein